MNKTCRFQMVSKSSSIFGVFVCEQQCIAYLTIFKVILMKGIILQFCHLHNSVARHGYSIGEYQVL